MAKYSVHQQPVETLLSWIKSGDIAIPEIQRPFVWKAVKVRDLIDSLYQGYPVGYIITWRNPDVKLKNGELSAGKKVLIDGQQRITALTAAIVGQRVLNKNYKEINIRIAFNPLNERFEVLNKAYEKSPEWINNINPIVNDEISITKAIRKYIKDNPEADEDLIEDFCSEYPEGDAGRRQDLEPCYIRNGGIYSMKRDTLMNERTRHGKISRPYVMEDKSSGNIDNEMDLKLAEIILKELNG